MIEIKINNEIRSVKSDFLGGLSLYETSWCTLGIILGAAAGLLIYFKLHFPLVLTSYISLIIAAPFIFMGLFRYHEMTGLDLIKLIVNELSSNNVLTYGSQNEYFLDIKQRERQQRKEERANAITDIKKRISSKKKKSK